MNLLNDIYQHWQRAGEELSLSEHVTPTSRDPYLGKLENEYMFSYLQASQTILEVGCGDAAHTVKYAKKVKFIWALDIADSLIKVARERAKIEGVSNISFTVGSVLKVGPLFADKAIDCVISQRCLINLPNWQNQKEAILQIHQLLKPGGLFLMTEGFQDELDTLNHLRQAVELPQINVVHYNHNFFHSEFDTFISQYFTIEAVRDYGLYLLLSRVYHPLVVMPEQPRHDSRLNEIAGLLSTLVPSSEFKRFSYNLFYVLRKK